MKLTCLLPAILFIGAGFSQVRPSDASSPNEAGVRQTLASFITAFDNLEWDKFRGFFSDDATVFYPRQVPERASGRAEFEPAFQKVFEQIRSGRSKPPYMDLQPRGMQIQMANGMAIVTFHLDDRHGFVNRRTLVLNQTSKGWKIIHLHASEVAIP